MHPMLTIAVRAARKAGDFIAKSAEQPDSIETQQKGSNDIVTNIDTTAEQIIIDVIKKSYPDHSIIAEESGEIIGKDQNYQWIIDPIDGTANFVRFLPHYCVSIALRIKGKTEIACVYDPVRNELFTGQRGAGAQLNSMRIRVSNAKELQGSILAGVFPYRAKQYGEGFMRIFSALLIECADFRQTGSAALDLCYLAAGRTDGIFAQNLKPWSLTAAELIARESGALCTDFTGNTNYFSSGNLIAANPKLIKSILTKVREHGTEAIMR